MSQPIEITVGGAGPYDPAAGTSLCSIPLLKGLDFYVEKIGYGTFNGFYTAHADGGFQLSAGTFSVNEKFFVHLTGLSYGTNAGSYSNGFDFTRVINALFGRVGWSQVPATPVLNSTNLVSKGGRKFNDGSFHSVVTLSNIKATMEQSGATDGEFNTYIEGVQRAAIMRCLNGVFREPELLEQVLLYNRLGQNDQPVPNEGLFVGYEIDLAKSMDIGVQIDAAVLLFDTDIDLNLYLFKDGKKTPLFVQEVSIMANEATVVRFTDLVLNYIGSATAGHKFYFGYFQDDLGSAKAIKEQVDCWNDTLCFSARPMITEKIAAEYDINRDERSYTMEAFGMNLEMSSFRDHTQQVVKKASLFDEVLGLIVAYMTIEQMTYAVRSNTNERQLKSQLEGIGIQLDLNGAAPISEGPRVTGLKQRIEKELERCRKQFFPKPKAQTISLC